MIDWRDPARRDDIRFQMVDPNDLDKVYGDLTDVQLGSSDITYGYYTDTRYCSSISFLKSNNYIENAWVRIIHDVPSEGYSNELGTFIPTSPSEKRVGAVVVTLDLQSPLWGLKDDLLTSKFSIGKKSSLLNAMKRIMESSNRPYLLNNPNDSTAWNAIVYDVGESKLKVLHDLADQTGNRIDIDGHGRLVIEPAPNHASVTPQWTLDYDDPRSMIVEGSLEMESEVEDLPSRAIVVNGNSIGYADLADGVSYSAHQRGYVKAKKYEDKIELITEPYLNTEPRQRKNPRRRKDRKQRGQGRLISAKVSELRNEGCRVEHGNFVFPMRVRRQCQLHPGR